VTSGINFAFFDPSLFEYIEDSAQVVSVKNLEYRFQRLELYDQNNDHDFIDPKIF
jgi:hypothetical protein